MKSIIEKIVSFFLPRPDPALRRRFKRIPCDIPAKVAITIDNTIAYGEVTIVDITAHGLGCRGLQFNEPQYSLHNALNADLTISFTLATISEEHYTFEVIGIITSIHESDANESDAKFGIMLHSIRQVDRERLQECIDIIEAQNGEIQKKT